MIFLAKRNTVKGFANILSLWHDRITTKLYSRPWKTTLYLCHPERARLVVQDRRSQTLDYDNNR